MHFLITPTRVERNTSVIPRYLLVFYETVNPLIMALLKSLLISISDASLPFSVLAAHGVGIDAGLVLSVTGILTSLNWTVSPGARIGRALGRR